MLHLKQMCLGSAAQIPAFYMDTSHLFSTPHPRLGPPSLAQQQGFQPGLSQVEFHFSDTFQSHWMSDSEPTEHLGLAADCGAADSHPHLCVDAGSAPAHTPGSTGAHHWAACVSTTGPIQLLTAALQVCGCLVTF